MVAVLVGPGVRVGVAVNVLVGVAVRVGQLPVQVAVAVAVSVAVAVVVAVGVLVGTGVFVGIIGVAGPPQKYSLRASEHALQMDGYGVEVGVCACASPHSVSRNAIVSTHRIYSCTQAIMSLLVPVITNEPADGTQPTE